MSGIFSCNILTSKKEGAFILRNSILSIAAVITFCLVQSRHAIRRLTTTTMVRSISGKMNEERGDISGVLSFIMLIIMAAAITAVATAIRVLLWIAKGFEVMW